MILDSGTDFGVQLKWREPRSSQRNLLRKKKLGNTRRKKISKIDKSLHSLSMYNKTEKKTDRKK